MEVLLKFVLLLFSTLSLIEAGPGKEHEIAFINYKIEQPMTEALRIDPPQNLVVTTISSTELYVTWDPPSEEVKSYSLEWIGGEDSGEEFPISNNYLLSDLVPCAEYFIYVRFVDSDNSESDPTNETGTTYEDVPPAPNTVELLIISPDMMVSWKMPTDIFPCPITNYSVCWDWQNLWGNEDEGGECDLIHVSPYYIKDVLAYSNFTVCVQAGTQEGYGPPTCQWNITEMDVPSAPILLNATSGYGRSEVTWDPPIMENGIIERYKITWQLNETQEEEQEVGNVLEHILPLQPCTPYNITVTAMTEIGWGPPSDAADVFTLNNETPKNVTCSASENNLRVEWTSENDDCPVEEYLVSWDYHTIWSNRNDSDEIIVNGLTQDLDINGLFYTQYKICVSTLIDGTQTGASMCCHRETEEGVPGEPLQLEISGGENGASIHLSWKPPEEQNGNISSYRISWKSSTGVTGNMPVAGTELEAEGNFPPCETYEITLAAATSKGYGKESVPVEVYVENYVPPEKVTCTFVAERSVKISWNTAEASCADPGFHIAYNWTTIWSSPYQDSNAVDLGPGTLEFSIANVKPYSLLHSCVGVGAVLDPGACCSITTQQEVPGPPENLNVTDIGNTHVNVTWESPTEINGEVIEWTISWISYEEEEDENNTELLKPETMSYVIHDLIPSTEYIVIVQASTKAGMGDITNTSFITIDVENEGPNMAAIIGGAIGGFLFLVLCAGIVFFLVKKKVKKPRKTKKSKQPFVNPGKKEHEFKIGLENFSTSLKEEVFPKNNILIDKARELDNKEDRRSSDTATKTILEDKKSYNELEDNNLKFTWKGDGKSKDSGDQNGHVNVGNGTLTTVNLGRGNPLNRYRKATLGQATSKNRQLASNEAREQSSYLYGGFLKDSGNEDSNTDHAIAKDKFEESNQGRAKSSYLYGGFLKSNSDNIEIVLGKSFDTSSTNSDDVHSIDL